MMKINAVCRFLNHWCSLDNAEDFDNVGLLIGDPQWDLKGVLVTLDTTQEIIQEAIRKNCNLIVSFHPIIFSGLKSLTPKTYVQKTVIMAVENKIAVYAIHTALDNYRYGVSHVMAQKLGLIKTQVFIPKKGNLLKLSTYVPNDHLDSVLDSIHHAGAGQIGDYDQCSFTTEGQGSFRGNQNSNPAIGKPLEKTTVTETQIQVVFHKQYKNEIVKALKESHPYEEVAYEIFSLENPSKEIGMGIIGLFEKPLPEFDFLRLVKNRFGCHTIRHSKLIGRNIKTVVVLGGSGSFVLDSLKGKEIDAFISSDLKYHHFFQAENKMIFLDIGHYESEQYTKDLIYKFLCDKMSNFAVLLSETLTNPVYYF